MNISKEIIIDKKYIVGLGMGNWCSSIESATINVGDVRLIAGVLMYAYTVDNGFFKPQTVNWVPVDDKFNTPENMRHWIKSL